MVLLGLRRISVFILIASFAAVCLKWLPLPYIWIYGFASLVSFLQLRVEGKSVAPIWFNLGSIFLILLVFEIALEVRRHLAADGEARIETYQQYDEVKDPVLGYVLRPNSRRRAWKTRNGETVYDVIYTVTRDGLRISPPCLGSCERSILFFGGSFTYGQGVNDYETMPYQVGVRASPVYSVYNFGVHGYGPQHMLALAESGKVTSTVDDTVDFAIYQALYPAHVYRVAGLRWWVRDGPRYILDVDGRPSRKGTFSDDDWPLVRSQIGKSAFGKLVLDYTRPIRSKDEDLFAAVVIQTAQVLRKTYPRLEFHILIWGETPETLVSRLEAEDIDVHLVYNILSAYDIPGRKVIRWDGHPTASAHSALADYVMRRIVRSGKVQEK